jgi:hypothetical protein
MRKSIQHRHRREPGHMDDGFHRAGPPRQIGSNGRYGIVSRGNEGEVAIRNLSVERQRLRAPEAGSRVFGRGDAARHDGGDFMTSGSSGQRKRCAGPARAYERYAHSDLTASVHTGTGT